MRGFPGPQWISNCSRLLGCTPIHLDLTTARCEGVSPVRRFFVSKWYLYGSEFDETRNLSLWEHSAQVLYVFGLVAPSGGVAYLVKWCYMRPAQLASESPIALNILSSSTYIH